MSEQEDLAGLLDMVSDVPRPTDYMSLSGEELETELRDLEQFVNRAAWWWRFNSTVLPACWMRHPEMVLILGAFKDYYTWVFSPGNSAAEMYGYLVMVSKVRDDLMAARAQLQCTVGHQQLRASKFLVCEHPDFESDSWPSPM